MALPYSFASYGLRDCKVYPMLTDPEAGGSPTYDTGLDIPGGAELSYELDMQEAEAYGDDRVHAIHSRIKSGSGTLTVNRHAFEAYAAILGGTFAESGSTPNQLQEWTLSGDGAPPYFKLACQSYLDDTMGDADAVTEFYKCRVTGFSRNRPGEDWTTAEITFRFIRTLSDDKLFKDSFRETAAALSVTSDSTAPTVASTSPADADTGVAVGANVEWTFSEALRESTVNTDNFLLVKASDGSIIAGAVSYNSGTYVVTFNPTGNLGAATAYIAIATTSVRDAAGNALAAPSVINFTTA